jgi:hypothetical protein
MTKSKKQQNQTDEINHPNHYISHPSGVECIDIVEHMPYNIGCAVAYLWRCDIKHDDPIVDMRKAIWYIEREIKRRQNISE